MVHKEGKCEIISKKIKVASLPVVKMYFFTTKKMPIITRRKPIVLNNDTCSPNTSTPTIIAVSGSSAPIIEVFVAPISFIATLTVSMATIVGITAKQSTYIH